MSALAELQSRIQSTKTLIAEHERALADPNRTDPGIIPNNIRALEKLSRTLERQFTEAAQVESLEVYRYRLLEADEQPTALAGVGEAWIKFQELFSEVYNALAKSERAGKPKGKSRPEVRTAAPILGYAYSFSRSVGVVATVPREFTNLAGYSLLDEASKVIFDFIEAKNVGSHARLLGPAPIQALDGLVKTHIDNHFGIGLEWQSQEGQTRQVEVQYQDLLALHQEIANTTTETELIVVGELFMVNTKTNRFGVTADSGEIYEGDIVNAISAGHAASVPARYSVSILKTSRIIALESEPKTAFSLLRLSPLQGSMEE